jgi:hypothetical protein
VKSASGIRGWGPALLVAYCPARERGETIAGLGLPGSISCIKRAIQDYCANVRTGLRRGRIRAQLGGCRPGG